jgi:branched-chain amino acid transport system ATP-binding protein
MLELEKVDVNIAATAVLRAVDCTLERGRTYCLVGRNGAGKTTLMRTIMGVLETRAGSIRFEGADITREAPNRRLALGFGYMPEDRRLVPDLSVEDNILLPLLALGIKDAARLEWVYSLVPEAKALRERLPTLLSGGQQKLVALARALMAGTRVLLLDEPTEGVAPLLQERIRTILRTFSRTGALVLIAESNSTYLPEMADGLYLIERGRVRLGELSESRRAGGSP